MYFLHQIGLLLHIVGIFCLAGGSVGGQFVEALFWRYVRESSEKAPALGPLLQRLPVVIQIGSLLMLVSGLLMLGSVGWAYWGQGWFFVKIALYLLLFLNGLLVGKPLGMAIGGQMRHYPTSSASLLLLRPRMQRFHITQTFLILALLGVTMFRF
jgi:hypothetical protein